MAKRKSKKDAKKEEVVEVAASSKTSAPPAKSRTILPVKSAKDLADLKERIDTLERLVQSVLDRVVGN